MKRNEKKIVLRYKKKNQKNFKTINDVRGEKKEKYRKRKAFGHPCCVHRAFIHASGGHKNVIYYNIKNV